jgi:hypothetical protein
LQKMVVWKINHSYFNTNGDILESPSVIDQDRSLIIEETILDLRKKQLVYNENGQSKNLFINSL